MVFTFTKPIARLIATDFTSSGFLKSIHTPSIVMITDKTADYPAVHFQAFADKKFIKCFVAFPFDGDDEREIAIKPLLSQIVSKHIISLPTYILYNIRGKTISDSEPLTITQLEEYVLDNI